MVLADSSAGPILTFVGIAIFLILLFGNWLMFQKAGQRGWTCIIPILNLLVLLRIVRRPLWWIVLMIIPIVNLVVFIIVMLDLAKVFGKGVGWAIGLILLPWIFLVILGLGAAQYQPEPDPLF
jgi:hypothetical protein